MYGSMQLLCMDIFRELGLFLRLLFARFAGCFKSDGNGLLLRMSCMHQLADIFGDDLVAFSLLKRHIKLLSKKRIL